jgi:hypothetical protein
VSATNALVPNRKPPNMWLWLTFVTVALVIGSIAGFYLWRM